MIKANDAFEFVVEDVWGNRSNPQEFIVAWSSISFDFAKLDICEEESKDKNVQIKLKRYGDIFQSVTWFSTHSLTELVTCSWKGHLKKQEVGKFEPKLENSQGDFILH